MVVWDGVACNIIATRIFEVNTPTVVWDVVSCYSVVFGLLERYTIMSVRDNNVVCDDGVVW
jgi:hypothetical protein